MRSKYRKEMLHVIDKDPSGWPALQAAYFVCSNLSDESQESKECRSEVCKVLLDHHIQRQDIGVLLSVMVERGDDGALEFCRQVMERCASPQIKVQANAAVALLRIQSLAASPSLNLAELQSSRKDVEDLAKHLDRDYTGVASYGEYAKQLAKSVRKELANMRVGLPAPEIKDVDNDGKNFKLSDYKGKVVILDFFVNWCPYCKQMYPVERKIVEENRDRPVVLLGVNGDNQQVLNGLIQKKAVTWRCWAVGESSRVFKDWGVSSYPTVFLIDQAGVVRRRFSGEPSQNEFDEAVETLIAETGTTASKKPQKIDLETAVATWQKQCGMSAEETAEAIREAAKISTTESGSPSSLLCVGELRVLAHQPDDAVTLIKRAIDAGGSESYYYKSLGWALSAAGKYSEAQQAFTKAIGSTPIDSAHLDQLAAAYYLGQIDGEDFVRRAIAKGPRWESFARFYIGQQKWWKGDRAGARIEFAKAVDSAQKAKATTTTGNWAAAFMKSE